MVADRQVATQELAENTDAVILVGGKGTRLRPDERHPYAPSRWRALPRAPSGAYQGSRYEACGAWHVV